MDKKEYTIQVKLTAILDTEHFAKSIEDGCKIGRGLKWPDVFIDRVSVVDGNYDLVGVFRNWNWPDKYVVQVKVTAVIDVLRYAESVENATEIGRNFHWGDFLKENVGTPDGDFELVGAWDNECWDVTLPEIDGLVLKSKAEGNKIVTVFKLLGRTIAIWNQAK